MEPLKGHTVKVFKKYITGSGVHQKLFGAHLVGKLNAYGVHLKHFGAHHKLEVKKK